MGDLEGKQIRIGIVGAASIGKTCVIKRFVENTFHGSQYNPTPGVDFFSRRMSLKTVGPHTSTVTFIIVDVGHNALNSKMLPIYIHGIDIFLLAYDMTNSATLNDLRKWITIVNAFSSNRNNDSSMALVGCKGDLEHLRAVRLDAHSKFAQEHNISLSFLASAKSGESVLTCFSKCAIYHLNPEAKQRVREHAILQASIPPSKRGSFAGMGPPHNHPILMPPSTQGIGFSKTVATPPTGSTPKGQSAAIVDPNSTVCILQ